jgi:hypothetical protein
VFYTTQTLDIKIVGVQSRNKCSLWNVERKEWGEQIYFQKILKLKIYYAKWTLRIEVVNGKKIFIIEISELIL